MPDWLPKAREAQLAMSTNWQTILTSAKVTAWNIPAAEVTALKALTATAVTALATEQSPTTHNTITTAQCRVAFEALINKMRLFKSHYFLTPPLVDADYLSLGLKPKDTKPTPIPPPTAQAEADITYPAAHQLVLHLHPLANSLSDPHNSDYGYRVYYGILPPGGAGIETATGTKRELMRAPVSGDELPHSRFSRRQRLEFDFPQTDSGKTIYFCVRFENAKGEPGPWGPLFSAVIP
jgi:hypothetical protein